MPDHINPRTLWRRYLLALAIILALLSGSHWATFASLHGGAEKATVINVSGRQRMLSQRIMYFAGNRMADPTAAVDGRLTEAIDLFQTSHDALSRGGAMGLSVAGAETRRAIYFDTVDGISLDALTRVFIADARRVADGSAEARMAAWNRMMDLGPGTVLGRLNAAVQAFEDMAHRSTERTQFIAHASFVLALLLLVCEMAIIFIPAQRAVNAAIERLQGAINRLSLARDEAAENLAAAEAARDRAESAERAKDRFLSHMSHELRTPLSGLVGMLDLLEDGEADPAQSERIAMARSAADHLIDISNDVLDLAKLQAGKLGIAAAPMCPSAVADAAVVTFGAQARAKGLILDIDIPDALPPYVMGDATRLRQIVFNLVGNAVKFTDSGSVTLHLAHGGDDLRIVVRDTGPGIPEDDRARLFESFEQIDQSGNRNHGGTGLGLAICRQLVLLMGGTIEIGTNPGGGSVFALRVPAPVAARDGDAPAVAGPAALPDVSGMSVLVAEDNLVNQKVVGAFLDRLRVTFEMVADGEQAVASAADNRFDAILLDIQMPRLDGFGAARRIRADAGPNQSAPLLAVTANVTRPDIDRIMASGFDAHLGKPMTLRDLADTLAALCPRADSDARPAA